MVRQWAVPVTVPMPNLLLHARNAKSLERLEALVKMLESLRRF